MDPCLDLFTFTFTVLIQEVILCILNRQPYTVGDYLECSRYSDIAEILQLGGTADKEASQCRTSPHLKRPPCMACYGVLTFIHMIKKKVYFKGNLTIICKTYQVHQEKADIRSLPCDSAAMSPKREP